MSGVMEDYGKLTRIAIVNSDKCKPKDCGNQPCKRQCPVVRQGKLCIEVNKESKMAAISEELCIGCGSCTKSAGCPFNAITIINLPTNLSKDTMHRYSQNSFKLHRLPTPRKGEVLGLIGANGTGKSTALQILSGKIKPNLGNFKDPPHWDEIMKYFRGSELFNYFTKLNNNELKTVTKPQNVDFIPKVATGTVKSSLDKYVSNKKDLLINQLELNHILDREIKDLSGGELQRFAICVTILRDADVYIFDEPMNYLDVRQRINVAKIIRSILDDSSKYVILVEHDLAILDYMSDFVCLLYGTPGAYGVSTLPYSVREGINAFLDGFIKSENMRIRDYSINFKISEVIERDLKKHNVFKYPNMKKTLGDFTLNVNEGEFNDSEIVVLVGQNGTGKTTFIRMLAGKLKPDDNAELPELRISYKPQKISPTFNGTVRQLLYSKIQSSFIHPQFITDVIKPMKIDNILDNDVKKLSGGELQRVAIILCLGQPADIYLIDEPGSFLDAEQRLIVAKLIKRFILHAKKTAFIVEHDFLMATYLADKIIVYDGKPGINCTANSPQSLLSGMNKFLKELDITFRKDPTNFRPRINKLNSQMDREQKENGTYFYLDD